MKTLVFIFILLIFSGAEAQNYYYQSGSPTDPANWNTMPDGSGTNAVDFAQNVDYVIPTGKTATVFSPWYFHGWRLVVLHGATLQNDLSVQMDSNSVLYLDSGALYVNNNVSIASQTIFKGYESFNKYSTVRIDNWSSVNESIINGVNYNLFNRYFGNLEINWTLNSGMWYQYIWNPNLILCENNFVLNSTGTGKFLFHYPSHDVGEQQVVRIKGDYIQNGGTLDLSTNSIGSGSFGMDMRLSKNFIQNGGSIVTSGAKYGRISFVKQIDSFDTTYQTFYNYLPISISGDVQLYVPLGCSLRLLSDIGSIGFSALGGLYAEGGNGSVRTYIDFQYAKLTGLISFTATNNTKIFFRSPDGYSGNIATGGIVNISNSSLISFAGGTPQVTGLGMPYIFPSIEINNPSGVTLSKNLKTSDLYLTSGTLNLGDYNLIVPNVTYITGVNVNTFINTNGNGYFKTFVPSNEFPKIPVGNTTYSPVWLAPTVGHTADTFSIRVKSGFDSSAMPSDTSCCVKKTWDIVENIPGGSVLRLLFQWRRSDEGSNFNKTYDKPDFGDVGVYNEGSYNGYKPHDAAVFEPPFSGTFDTTISRSSNTFAIGNNGIFSEFNTNNKYVVGLQRGIYEYYFYNSGNAASLTSWKRNADGTGASPQSSDRYEIFHVPQNKNAVFNSSIVFSNKTILRLTGNGQITSNQPIINLGNFELYDSSTYNHNNIGVAASSIFAGKESFSEKSTFNITMWSDTANAIRDGLQSQLSNLVINFTNLADPGANGRWRNSKFLPSNYFCRNLQYIQSSGYELCLVGEGNENPSLFPMFIRGNLQLGDSLIAPDANPVINLSFGTSQPVNSTAGSLSINGNLDIQRGKIHSEENVIAGKGTLKFGGISLNRKHFISSYQPADQPVYNIGTSNYPNEIWFGDTVVLKTNFYNSINQPFNAVDFLVVNEGGVLDCDTFAFRGMGIRVKSGGKIIIRNKEGINFELHNLQNITFEDGGMLELAGYENQKLYKAGTTPMPNIPNLVINNPNGITINEIVTITDTLRFVQGKVNSTLVYLQFTDTTASKGATSTSYIEAPVRLFTKSTLTKIIPLGKNGKLRPLYFQPADVTPSQWIVQYDTQDPHTIGSTYGPGINNISSNEYYFINKFTSIIGAYIGLSFGPESGVSNIDSLRIARWNGSQWENKGNVTNYGTPSSGYVTSEYCSDFDFFALSSTNSQPMPVELSSFNSSVLKNDVTLNWSTSQEQNNIGFEIERKLSADTSWKKISFINGAGNSNAQVNYKYEDKNLATGKYHYRLKQIDNNGNYKHYALQNEVSVGVPQKFALSQNYPNPFNPSTKISFNIPEAVNVTLEIYDITGKLITSLIDNKLYQSGYYTIDMNGASLSSGTYFYRLQAGEFIQTKKMLLLK